MSRILEGKKLEPDAEPTEKVERFERRWIRIANDYRSPWGWVILVLYVGILTLFLVIPEPFWFFESGSHTKEVADGLVVGWVLHITSYTVFTILLLWLVNATSVKTLYCVAILFVHAAAMEMSQSFVSTRSANMLDLFADILGIAIGIWVWCKLGNSESCTN